MANPYDPNKEYDKWLDYQKQEAAGAVPPPATPGGTTGAAAPKPGAIPGTGSAPNYQGGGGGSDTNYAAKNVADRKAEQLKNGWLPSAPANSRPIGSAGNLVTSGGITYSMDMDTKNWKPGYATSANESRLALRSGAPLATGATTPGAQMLGGGGGGYSGSLTGNAPVGAPGTGAFLPGTAGLPATLPTSAGVTLPGMEAFNIPGLGIESEGRRTLYDNNGLNTMYAGSPNGPQIQAGPGMRNGRFGNSIQFGGSGGTTAIKPQIEFPSASVSVPGSYQQGVGNVGPMGGIMPFSAPYNIGPGGAGLMNIGGSNVQLNSADKSFGMGFAMTPQTPSDKFAATDIGLATGRSLNSDPALQSAQILQLMAAINQMGGGAGAIDALTAAERNQYSGNPPTSQGTWFSGAAPGPQMTPYEPPAPTAPNGNPLLDAVLASAPGGRAGGGGGGAGAAPGPAALPRTGPGSIGYLGTSMNGQPTSGLNAGFTSAVPNYGVGAYGPGFGTTAQQAVAPPPGPGSVWGQGIGAGLGAPVGAPNPALGAAAPAAAPAMSPAEQQLAALLAAQEEEDRAGAEGPGGMRGFATGGSVNTLPMGPLGSTVRSPTDAAPADPALAGSLASPGAGAAVQNSSPTQALNPAENAIQPVQGPQNTTSVINNNAWSVPATAQSQTAPAAAASAPGQADPLAAFYAAQQKQAMQQRMRNETFGNRWQAAGLSAPTAVQLQPGAQVPEGYLPPGQYYSIEDALNNYINQISQRQTTLAGLGEIGDPGQLMAQMTQYEVAQAPYKQALDIQTQLAGLGAGGTANLEGLAQQQALLKEQMGPLAEVSDLNARLRGLGSPFSQEAVEAQSLKIQGLEDQIREYNSALGEDQGAYAGILGPNPYADELIRAQKVLDSERNTLSQMFSRNNEISQTTNNLSSFMQSLGVSDIGQLDEMLGSYAAQQDALKNAYQSALQGETYRNQIASLTGGLSATDEMARYQQLINQAKIGYGNVETAQRLNNEISNLAQKGATLPGFAKGGSWIAGATKNAHGQFRAKAKAAGMSTKAYASKMADAPGRTGKQARLAKTLMGFAEGGNVDFKKRKSRGEEMLENLGAPPNSGRIMGWYPGYASGGSMTTEEPIIGIGLYTGQPRFQVGEPQYPGGPPMAERLNIEPLNRPSQLPMGGMRRAA